jgi:hypothetical protein
MMSAPAIGKNARLLSVGPDGDTLALVFFNMETGQGHKDAQLIAAAPELLRALKMAAESAGFQYMTYETREFIAAAIAKAENPHGA